MRKQKEKTMVSFALPTDVLMRLDTEAALEGLSRTDVVRRLLLRHVREQLAATTQSQVAT